MFEYDVDKQMAEAARKREDKERLEEVERQLRELRMMDVHQNRRLNDLENAVGIKRTGAIGEPDMPPLFGGEPNHFH
jgi:hypothetical protein